MQLFILDRIPGNAARMLADIHLRKMCMETAQILSAAAVNRQLVLPDHLPKAYNPAHPVIKALNTQFKLNWCIKFNYALHQEYFRRFKKFHAYNSLCDSYKELLYADIPEKTDWSFARAFKNFTTGEPDIVSAYRAYYRFKKSIIRQWHYTNAEEPAWLKDDQGSGKPPQ